MYEWKYIVRGTQAYLNYVDVYKRQTIHRVIVVVHEIVFWSGMVISIEECIFIVKYVFCEDGNYTDKMKDQFSNKIPQAYQKIPWNRFHWRHKRNGRPSTLNEQKLLDI